MVVLKFGGSSVKDASSIDACLAIMQQHKTALLAVFSASGDTTDVLEEIAALVKSGDAEAVERSLQSLRAHHIDILEDFGMSETSIAELLEDLSSFVHGMTLLRECTARSRDTLLSFGELLSTKIIAERLAQRGQAAHLADSRALFVTDSDFGKAVPDMKETAKRMRTLPLAEGRPVVVQGFIGANACAVTTTFGRGGSDYTAAIAGASLKAERIEIWTDVSGIMTCDPRMIPEARSVAEMSYDEAAELAYFGAKVVHPLTIQPAVEHKIPVYIKKTTQPEHPGTCIRSHTSSDGVKAIAVRKGVYLVQLRSSRMLNAYGFLKRMFAIFADAQVSIDLVTTSEVSVTVSTDEKPQASLVRALSSLGTVTVEERMGIICLVGRKVWQNPEMISRVFAALEARTPVRMISLGSSDTNLSLSVRQKDIVEISSRLHRVFFS